MNKIKVIDLLNMISKGEEVPKKIKYEKDTYIHIDNYCYYCEDTNLILSDRIFAEYSKLNDEVEILEETKKIEKLDVALLGQCDNWLRCPTNKVTKQDVELNPYIIDNIRENTLYFQRKINELIDEINNLK